VPYLLSDDDLINAREKNKASEHAEFIDWCFNNSTKIINSAATNHPQSAIKEQVDLHEIWKEFEEKSGLKLRGAVDRIANPAQELTEFLIYIQKNYNLISKPCATNTENKD